RRHTRSKRDGVQTCALPIFHKNKPKRQKEAIKNLLEISKEEKQSLSKVQQESFEKLEEEANEIIHNTQLSERTRRTMVKQLYLKIGRASCRERVKHKMEAV